MNLATIKSPFITQWSFLDDLLMTIDNKNNVYILSPHEITDVRLENENLVVTASQPVKGQTDEQKYSFELHPSVVFLGVAEKAEKADLPVALYAASVIQESKEEEQQESDRFERLRQSFDKIDTKSPADKARSTEMNRVFLVLPLMAAGLFAAMVHFGHGHPHKEPMPPANHKASALRPNMKLEKQPPVIIPN